MPLRNDILKPVPDGPPGGSDLRLTPVYSKIKEARREDDARLPQGDWKHERKVADHALAVELIQDVIATRSKDLQLAAWLTESLAMKDGFAGLAEGLRVCQGLVQEFWDSAFPLLEEDDDVESRAMALDWINRVQVVVRSTPLCKAGHGLMLYQGSRTVPTDAQSKTSKEQKTAREAAIREGKITPEEFDNSFSETPKQFYVECEANLGACLQAVEALHETCYEKFVRSRIRKAEEGRRALTEATLVEQAPTFNTLKKALEEVRHAAHSMLSSKRKMDPDPPVAPASEPSHPVPAPVPIVASGGMGAAVAAAPAAQAVVPASDSSGIVMVALSSAGPADMQEAVAAVVRSAAFLRVRDPHSAAPYLMLRGLRWGELRSSRDPAILQAPPTELRQQLKTYALNGNWAQVLETAETLMGMPCGRAWLDLQRYLMQACAALGDAYGGIALAVRSELRTLLLDLPELLDASLTDDTPTANAETRAWLIELTNEPSSATPQSFRSTPSLHSSDSGGWRKSSVDPQVLAAAALNQGQPEKALEILGKELERQRSGRGRFLRKLQLAQLCIAANKIEIAQPVLDDLQAAVETHKLEDWEDREMMAGALLVLLQSSKKIQGDPKLKTAIFERICRLDPVQALAV